MIQWLFAQKLMEVSLLEPKIAPFVLALLSTLSVLLYIPRCSDVNLTRPLIPVNTVAMGYSVLMFQ